MFKYLNVSTLKSSHSLKCLNCEYMNKYRQIRKCTHNQPPTYIINRLISHHHSVRGRGLDHKLIWWCHTAIVPCVGYMIMSALIFFGRNELLFIDLNIIIFLHIMCSSYFNNKLLINRIFTVLCFSILLRITS